jgi:hypothetical protein
VDLGGGRELVRGEVLDVGVLAGDGEGLLVVSLDDPHGVEEDVAGVGPVAIGAEEGAPDVGLELPDEGHGLGLGVADVAGAERRDGPEAVELAEDAEDVLVDEPPEGGQEGEVAPRDLQEADDGVVAGGPPRRRRRASTAAAPVVVVVDLDIGLALALALLALGGGLGGGRGGLVGHLLRDKGWGEGVGTR